MEQTTSIAWAQERELVSFGHCGTHPWNEAEKAELLATGKVTGYQGQYIISVEKSPRLATKPNNIVFVKVGTSLPSKEVLHLASWRSYLLQYQKSKYLVWGSFVIAVIVLIVAIKKKFLVIINPALGGAVIGAAWFGMASGGSMLAVLGGLVSGLTAGVMAGIFMFLIFLSIGIA